MNDIDANPSPRGKLCLRQVAMPGDTNPHGDVFGGWLMSQMDLAGYAAACEAANGRVATVAVEGMSFLTPVHVGAVVGCYTEISEIGRSSVRVMVEVWINSRHDGELIKVTEGTFVYVAIDADKRTRQIGT